jgi:fused signal recognition particle receptor
MARPKKYVVIASSVGGLNNKIYQENDVVSENNFIEGHAELLVKQEFLKRADDKLTKAEEQAEKEAAAEKLRLANEQAEKEAAEKAQQEKEKQEAEELAKLLEEEAAEKLKVANEQAEKEAAATVTQPTESKIKK